AVPSGTITIAASPLASSPPRNYSGGTNVVQCPLSVNRIDFQPPLQTSVIQVYLGDDNTGQADQVAMNETIVPTLLNTGAGNDIITSTGGCTVVNGGAGSDTLNASGYPGALTVNQPSGNQVTSNVET